MLPEARLVGADFILGDRRVKFKGKQSLKVAVGPVIVLTRLYTQIKLCVRNAISPLPLIFNYS